MEQKRTMVSIPFNSRVFSDLERFKAKSTRVLTVYQRYLDICRAYPAPELSDAEQQVLMNIVSGAKINRTLIRSLDIEIEDSDDYLGKVPAALSLLKKVRDLDFAAIYALLDRLGV